jgi:hypothetical protein
MTGFLSFYFFIFLFFYFFIFLGHFSGGIPPPPIPSILRPIYDLPLRLESM